MANTVVVSKMRFGSLFSGIEGLGLGLERAGMSLAWHSEIDPYCASIHERHWPDVPNLGDVTAIDWSDVERVDLICGGYPCQPFSYAGNRHGAEDQRHLWPYMFDAVRALRPNFVLIENVAGHLSLGFDRVLADLASIGFDAEWSLISACALGAPHPRQRLFCVAYAAGDHEQDQMSYRRRSAFSYEPRRSSGRTWRDWWLSEPPLDRVADGIPARLVREPLAALGNAVVPQVAEFIGRNIMEMT